MRNEKLLDCTLRDGGYINDWEFGTHTIRDILKKLVESNVDYVEVGFLRDCDYISDKTLFNCCADIANILPEDKGNTLFSAMALHNRYDINKLEPYDGKTIDIIRVTFHDYDIEEGLEYIRRVKEKGYKVFCNPINIMGYSDSKLIKLLNRVNEIKPYGFSIVDTFGSMLKSDLQRIYLLTEHILDKSIVIGLHLHENLGLSYSLAQEFLSLKSSERRCVIDGSMFGMGRSPGNLCLELIMNYMNNNLGSSYDTNPILDGIDDHIMKIRRIEAWGYNTAYSLSAKYNLHRNYAEFLLNKGRLRAKQINQILSCIDDDKKTAYDENYAEALYESFQNNEVDDSEIIDRLKSELASRSILILAPGESISKQKDKVIEFIEQEKPIVVSTNFVPTEYLQDYVFFSNEMRYSAIEGKLPSNVIITSNLSTQQDGVYVINYADVCLGNGPKCDNSVIMLIRLMIRLSKKRVYVAGFDGYSPDGSNYVDSYMMSQHTKGEEENRRNRRLISDIRKLIDVSFITDSLYEIEEDE